MITDRQLALIAPHCPRTLRAKVLPLLQQVMRANEINTVTRAAGFIANLCVESGEFRYTAEIWGDTPAQQRYDTGQKAIDLGNTPERDGDGKYRKGYGWIQTTGGKNQRRVLRALGLDPEQDPRILAEYPYCGLSAAFYWRDAHCNGIADQLTGRWDATERAVFRRLVKAINGGTTHLAEREVYYLRAVKAFKSLPGFGSQPEDAPPVTPPVLEPGRPAPSGPATETVSNENSEDRSYWTGVLDRQISQSITPEAARSLALSTAARARGPLLRLAAWLVAAFAAGDKFPILVVIGAVLGLIWLGLHYRRHLMSQAIYLFSRIKERL